MYYAAFEHTTGIYTGTRFWCCYASKQEFDKAEINTDALRVVGQGEDKNEIQAIGLDYDKELLFDVALGKTEERRQKALARFNEHGDKVKYAQELRNIAELHKYEMVSAQLCATL